MILLSCSLINISTSDGNGTAAVNAALATASSLFGWAYALPWTFEFYIKLFAWSFYTWKK
jgi:hypothetical protein